MINLKLITYDNFECVYEYCGLYINGKQSQNEFTFFFPELKLIKAIQKKIDTSYILERYTIPRPYGEDLNHFLHYTVKKELEEELTKKLKNSNNKQTLIDLIFNEVVVLHG